MNQEQIQKYNNLIKSIIELQKKPDVKNLQRTINKAFYLSLEIPGEKQRFYNNMVDFLEQKD